MKKEKLIKIVLVVLALLSVVAFLPSAARLAKQHSVEAEAAAHRPAPSFSDGPQYVNTGEAMTMLFMKAMLTDEKIPVFSASITAYDRNCESLDSTILGMAGAMATEHSAIEMADAEWKVKAAIHLGVDGKSFCETIKPAIEQIKSHSSK